MKSKVENLKIRMEDKESLRIRILKASVENGTLSMVNSTERRQSVQKTLMHMLTISTESTISFGSDTIPVGASFKLGTKETFSEQIKTGVAEHQSVSCGEEYTAGKGELAVHYTDIKVTRVGHKKGFCDLEYINENSKTIVDKDEWNSFFDLRCLYLESPSLRKIDDDLLIGKNRDAYEKKLLKESTVSWDDIEEIATTLKQIRTRYAIAFGHDEVSIEQIKNSGEVAAQLKDIEQQYIENSKLVKRLSICREKTVFLVPVSSHTKLGVQSSVTRFQLAFASNDKQKQWYDVVRKSGNFGSRMTEKMPKQFELFFNAKDITEASEMANVGFIKQGIGNGVYWF